MKKTIKYYVRWANRRLGYDHIPVDNVVWAFLAMPIALPIFIIMRIFTWPFVQLTKWLNGYS